MLEHKSEQEFLNNHKTELIKTIAEIYIQIRLFHEGKCITQKHQNIRHKYSKMIHFKHMYFYLI